MRINGRKCRGSYRCRLMLIDRRQISVAIVLLVILSMPVLCVDPVHAAKAEMRGLIEENREHFLNTYDNWLNNSGSQNAAWLRDFLLGFEPERTTSLEVDTSSEDMRLALRRLVNMCKLEHVFAATTGYVEDKKMIPILVAALSDDDEEIRQFAMQMLTWNTRREDLFSWSTSIKNAVQQDDSETAHLLLAQLPLGPAERSALMSKPEVGIDIRARLGDKISERRLIAEFESESDYSRKKNLAKRLGYVGTEASARALVDALRSPVSIEGYYDDRSIRCDVLLALGHIYQDEDLFTRDAHLLSTNSEEIFDRHRGLESYITDVNTWVEQNFGKPAWGEDKVWFTRLRNIPIKNPPPTSN